MATVPANKSERIENAIQVVIKQLPPEVARRAWTPAAHAAMITGIFEQNGVKLTPEQKKSIRADLNDSDVQYTSNMRAYLTKRGLLPEKTAVEIGNFA
jgi:hypothetical protein